jgi:dTDP-4-amino-4,6-dideoxygalactose transaminase
MSSTAFLPFAVPDITESEISRVVEVMKSGWLTSGQCAAEFEQKLGSYTNAKHALAVNSCTAGLHLAFAALGLGPGDEVITTPLTFCATVNTILQVGAKPVLVDVGDDLNIASDAIRLAVTPKTRAIVPVHIAGLPCDMHGIWEIAREHGLFVIEDAAHAIGATYRDVPIGGGCSDAVVFSFYATKNLCTGEGGMVVTPSEKLYDRMRILCLHGISKDAWNRYSEKGSWYYEVTDCGFKYNMSDILAAVGVEQLARLDAMNARRKEIAQQYSAAFAGLEEVQLPPNRTDSGHAWHLYMLRLNLGALTIDRGEFVNQMRSRGIACSVHFIPIQLHPYYSKHLDLRHACPRSVSEYERLVSLPLYSKMTDSDSERVITAVIDVVEQNTRRTFRLDSDN